jgi:hypothetical protein
MAMMPIPPGDRNGATGGRVGGLDAQGGAGGAGMARCHSCGRGKLVSPSSLESCWTCCPPLHFRAAGEGDGASFLSSLQPSHLSHCRSGSAQSAERSARKPELVRGRGCGTGGDWSSGISFLGRSGSRLSREAETRIPNSWIPG